MQEREGRRGEARLGCTFTHYAGKGEDRLLTPLAQKRVLVEAIMVYRIYRTVLT